MLKIFGFTLFPFVLHILSSPRCTLGKYNHDSGCPLTLNTDTLVEKETKVFGQGPSFLSECVFTPRQPLKQMMKRKGGVLLEVPAEQLVFCLLSGWSRSLWLRVSINVKR